MKKLYLGIETSCDDTSVALVFEDGEVLFSRAANQDLEHSPYGGIVPEIASRNHSMNLLPLIDQALQESNIQWSNISGIAVTNRPGLIGALIVGLVTAKSLSQCYKIPFLGVSHLEGHLLAPFLKDTGYKAPENFTYPYIGLAISGGHTSLYDIRGLGEYYLLGETKDDAAGEAFDKFAKNIGLGFPGGVKIDQISRSGNIHAFSFPRSQVSSSPYAMSFSGLKSAGARLVQELGQELVQKNLADLCASYQEAIVDMLVEKLDYAMTHTGYKRAIVTGGVSANFRLREQLDVWAKKKQLQFLIPPLRYCTDNAAMIAYAGALRMNRGEFSPLNLAPYPQSIAGDLR